MRWNGRSCLSFRRDDRRRLPPLSRVSGYCRDGAADPGVHRFSRSEDWCEDGLEGAVGAELVEDGEAGPQRCGAECGVAGSEAAQVDDPAGEAFSDAPVSTSRSRVNAGYRWRQAGISAWRRGPRLRLAVWGWGAYSW